MRLGFPERPAAPTEDANVSFPLQVWPGAPVQLPLFTRRSSYRLDTSASALVGAADAVPVKGRLGEIYLRLYELDLDNPAQILAFAKRYGVVNGTLVHTAWQGWSFVWGRFEPAAELREREAVIAADREVHRALDPGQPDWPASFQPLEITPLSSFVFAARCLRDLTTAWLLLREDPTLSPPRTHWEVQPEAPPPNRADALEILTFGLQPLLRRFHPFVRPAQADDPEHGGDELDRLQAATRDTPEGAGPLLGQAPGPLYGHLAEICALELYNHIAGQDAYRRCQNETCRRIFVRHYGRAEHGQSRRQGVLYCSRSCANAQTQRVFKRRQRAKKHAQQEQHHQQHKHPPSRRPQTSRRRTT